MSSGGDVLEALLDYVGREVSVVLSYGGHHAPLAGFNGLLRIGETVDARGGGDDAPVVFALDGQDPPWFSLTPADVVGFQVGPNYGGQQLLIELSGGVQVLLGPPR